MYHYKVENKYFNILERKFCDIIKESYSLLENLNKGDRIKVLKKIRQAQTEKSAYFIVTLTTKCSLKCDYCFENGQERRDMSKKNLNLIINKIISYIKENGIEYIKIDLFGGDPFLILDKVKYFVDKINNFFKDKNTKVEYGIITNGIIVNSKFFEYSKHNNINTIQITFDGIKHLNDNRRRLKGENDIKIESVYDTIMMNMNEICENFDNVNIKYNVDLETLNFFEEFLIELKNNIDKQNLNKITLLIEAIQNTQLNINNILYFKNSNIYLAEIYVSLMKNAHDYGFKYKTKVFNTPCMVTSINSFLVNSNGKVSTCISDFNETELNLGTIKNITYRNSIKKREELNKDELLKDECSKCEFLPRCWGGCYYELIVNDKDSLKNLNCRKEFYTEFIKHFYKEMYLKRGVEKVE